jgi:Domain of unknown function (DUF4189)
MQEFASIIFRVTGVLLLAFVAMTLDLRAEGGVCPPGYYPISSPGFTNCAPIPGGGNSGSTLAPHDEPVWKTQWLSIAFGKNGFGAATEMPSKRKAEQVALAQCRDMGGTQCHINMTTYNQCIAVARGGVTAPSAGAHELEEAKALALAECEKDDRNSYCELYFSACSYPIRVR